MMQTLVMRRGSFAPRGKLDENTMLETEKSTRSTAALPASLLGRKLLANSILGRWILFVVDSLFNCLLSLSKHKLGRSWPQRRTLGSMLRTFLRDATLHARQHGVAGWFD